MSSEEFLEKMMSEEHLKLKSKFPPNDTEYQAVAERAYKEALLQFYKTIYLRQMVEDFMSDGTIPLEIKCPTKRAMIERRAASCITKPPFCMITVNPRPDTTLEQLQKKVEKFVSRKMILDYLYAYEVRNAAGGLHCHIIVRYQSKPFDLKRGAKSTFKSICDSNNPEILNFRWVEETDLSSKVQYIQGRKQDKKMKGVKATEIFRQENNLESIYKHPTSSLLGCEEIHN